MNVIELITECKFMAENRIPTLYKSKMEDLIADYEQLKQLHMKFKPNIFHSMMNLQLRS